nr:unnamed protein product [Spirometra erinaceieuropaei]
MVRPTIGVAYRLGHHHVLLISPLNEDIIQQLPASRSGVHPSGRPPHRLAEVGVIQKETVFSAGSQEAIVVAAGNSVRTQHYLSDGGVEVTEDKQLIRLRRLRQEGMKVFVEFVPLGVRAGHRRNADANDGGEFASPKRQVEAHQTVVGALRQTRQSSHDVVSYGNGDARVPSLCLRAATPEGVIGTNLHRLALFGEPGLTECSDVHLVTHQFRATSAVLRFCRLLLKLSKRERTFQAARVSGLTPPV